MMENSENQEINEKERAEVQKESAEVKEEPNDAASAPRSRYRRRRPRSRRGKRNPSDNPQDTADLSVIAEPSATQVSAAQGVTPESQDMSSDQGVVAAEPGEAPQTGKSSSRRRRRRPRKDKKPETAEVLADTEVKAETKPKDRTRRILINARYTEEKRVAIVEGDTLVEFYVEVAAREHLKGNIYKGVVSSVMPGLQAAFIDFGQKKHGFLQFREVMPGLSQAKEEVPEGRKRVHGSLLKGQEILVQVEKDEHGTKGASLTTYISIPGRYIVMMPGQKRVGISRKIESREDRDRLKETFNSLKLPKDTGFILRTACGDSLEKELNEDLKYLTKLWDRIKADAGKAAAPALIYKEQDMAMRTVRDYLTPEVVEILIDEQKTFTTTKAFLRKIMPWRKVNISHYREKKPLFSLHNVEAQIAGLSHREVRLPSKGYLVFDKAEALTAIDVNSGRSRKEDNIESTAFMTNLEAVEEIARQLRLRDIGGLIVIDFIDMESGRNRRFVETSMSEALRDDKASTEVAGLSKFCILEMTRERYRLAYAEAISRKCPLCEGIGSVNSDEFVALSAIRELHALAAAGDLKTVKCKLPVESANLLINTKKRELVALEQDYDITITVIADPSMPAGKYELEVPKHK